jgi:hypothetical protein
MILSGIEASLGWCHTHDCTKGRWLNARLREVPDAFWQIDPRVFGLFPHRLGWRWKIRVGKCTNGYAIMVRSEVKMPVDRTAASGTKVETDLPLHSFNVPRIGFFGTFHSDLRFVEECGSAYDRAGPSLAGLAVASNHDSWFATNRGTK